MGSFIAHGRVTNYAKVLFYLPRYLRCSSTCYEKLISSSRGIQKPVKMFVALLAAAEMGCQYFVSYFTAKFLEVGGDSQWLKGIHETPSKVQRIVVLNRKMVETPWAIGREDVKTLMETGEDEEGWTIGEVVQITTILAMFQAQSSIALGIGVVCEADVFGGTIWRRISKSADEETLTGDSEDAGFEAKGNGHSAPIPGSRQDIIDRLRMNMSAKGPLLPDVSFDHLHESNLESYWKEKDYGLRKEKVFREVIENSTSNLTPKNGAQKFLSALTSSNPATTPDHGPLPSDPPESPMNPIIEDLTRFTAHDTPARSIVFPNDQSVLSSAEYSWDDALRILSKHLPDLATNIDKRFHLPATRGFLQPRMHDTVDITPFKHSVQQYSLALVGILKESFNYSLIADFLNGELRRFVRRICLDGRGVTKGDWESLQRLGFSAPEIVEIGIMTSEARFMGVLMYALKVVGEL